MSPHARFRTPDPVIWTFFFPKKTILCANFGSFVLRAPWTVSAHMSTHARFRTPDPLIWTIFFQKKTPFCGPSLKASFSELCGPFLLIFGEHSDTVGGKRFWGLSPTPTSTRGPWEGWGVRALRNVKMSIQTEHFRIQI